MDSPGGGTRADSDSARSEIIVAGRTVYRDQSDPWNTWASKTDSPVDELRIASAAVPNRCRDIPIRVMNVAGYPVTLLAGVVLADLEAVEIVGDKDLVSDDTARRNGSGGHDGTDS